MFTFIGNWFGVRYTKQLPQIGCYGFQVRYWCTSKMAFPFLLFNKTSKHNIDSITYVSKFILGLTNFQSSQVKLLSKRFKQPNVLARMLVPSLPLTAFTRFIDANNPVKFLIVRHPYDRLLSAYRDKFEMKKMFYLKNYGKFIIGKYRKRSIRRFGKNFHRPNMNRSNNPGEHPIINKTQKIASDQIPTFWEFIRAIIDYGISDDHWMPATLSCSLCLVRNIHTNLQI